MTDDQNTTIEMWREILDFPAYEVSNLGRVRRKLDCRSAKAGHVLKPSPSSNGYPIVSLVRVKAFTRTVHRLVAIAWLGNAPFPGAVVNHKNGIRNDNRVENLEWCSHRENVRHAIYSLGKDRSGERHPQAKNSSAQVLKIHEAMMCGTPTIEIVRAFGVSETQLGRIRKRQTWKSVLQGLPDNYPPPRRLVRGSRVGTSKLVESQVVQIREMIRAGLSNIQIARQFGVSDSAIQFIRLGQSWKHVP